VARKSGKSKGKGKGKGKGKKSSKREAVKSSRRGAAVSSRKTKATSTRRTSVKKKSGRAKSSRSVGGSAEVTCRDCNYDFTMDVASAGQFDTLTCPVCEHRAQKPSQDILHQISLYKGIERGNLKFALVSVVIAFLAMVYWSVTSVDMSVVKAAAEGVASASARTELDPAKFYGPIAVAFIGFVAALIFGAKYERSRWVTYF
jgi:hypothetical protein